MSAKADFAKFGIGDTHSGLAIGTRWHKCGGTAIAVRSPIDGSTLSTVSTATHADVASAVDAAHAAFLKWRTVPAPKRGEFVRLIGEKLRQRKTELATLVSWEAGKIMQEALGEVQEMIDICEFAVGLSRQLYGLTIASERPGHRMMEQWHPLGVVGVISAFNFPVAVWAWNAMLALVCGDAVVWKPSEKTPLTAIATHNIVLEVLKEMPEVPADVLAVVIGDGANTGEPLTANAKCRL
jgi:aldehyde dehydrogenase (NAD+)